MSTTNAARKAIVDDDVAVLRPSKLFERLAKYRESRLDRGFVSSVLRKHTDAALSLAMLRMHSERPCGCRAGRERDELAPSDIEHGASSPSGRRHQKITT